MGNTPRIRFQSFTEEWEEKKLGDIFEEYSEKNHEELPPLTIIQGGGTIPRDESDRNLQYDRNSLSNYKMVKKDDFIVHLRSFEGGLEKANSDGIISPAYHTFHGEEADSRFYYSYFRSHEFIHRKLVPHVFGIRDGKSIDIEGMKTILIPYTSFVEQKKIGDFLDTIDNDINLHQRQLAETQTLKQYLLRNMFPAPGEAVPAIRFEEFEGEWEQKKLSQLLSFSNGYNGSKDSYGSGIPYISVMDILENDYITYDVIRNKVNVDETTASRFLVFYGDVLFQRSSENVEDAGKSNVYLDEERPALFGGFVIRGKKIADYDPLFMKRNLETVSVRHQMQATAQGAQHINISQETLSEIRAYFPSLEEQQRIGTFFAELDENINYTKQKITALNTLKQYLLQNMFPTKG